MKIIFTVLLAQISTLIFCQTGGGLGINPSQLPPDPSAALDINYTNKGFLPPRMNTAQRDAIPNPATGLVVFNTDCGVMNSYNGTTWIPVGNGGASVVEQPNISLPSGYACSSSTAYFSITPIPDAVNYIWQVPDGDTVVSGQGSTNVGVSLDSSSTNNWISVQAVTNCATSLGYTTFNLIGPGNAPYDNGPQGNYTQNGLYTYWNGVPNANYYEIDVASDSLFQNNFYAQSGFGCCGVETYVPFSCGTIYSRVIAWTPCGPSHPSNTVSQPVSATQACCQSVSNVQNTSANLNWSIQYEWDDIGFNVYVATDPAMQNPIAGSPFFASGEYNTQLTLNGLICGATYYWYVSAVDQCGNPFNPSTNYEGYQSFTTNSNPPAQPGAPTVSPSNICSGQTTVISAGNTGSPNNIWSGLPGDASFQGNPDSSTITFTTNTPGIYNISVAASCGGNNSPSSPTVADTVNSGVPGSGSVSGDALLCPYASGEVYTSAATNADSYLWTVPSDATIVSGQGTSSINISFGTMSGNVCVTVGNGCGTIAPSCTSVTMLSASGGAPVITGQPSNDTLCISQGNTSASFTVNASGSGLTYQWQVSTDNGNTFLNLTNGGVYSNVNAATLNITNPTSNFNAYQYRCAVGPCPISNSNAATLFIQAPGSLTFSYTGGLQTFTVPLCVNSITISAYGAQGGDHSPGQSPCGCDGGLGAQITGTFSVTPGAVYTVLVGGQGVDGACSNPWNAGAGGGGGSFIYDINLNLLIAAGGGGGGALIDDGGSYPLGEPGQSGNNGSASRSCWPGGTGGGDGQGNLPGYGWNSIVNNPNPCGCDGGYGGGGGYPTYECQYHGAGGGGGYSGGGGALGSDGCGGYGDGGGGGGSYNSGTNQTNTSAVQSGNGQVIINW